MTCGAAAGTLLAEAAAEPDGVEVLVLDDSEAVVFVVDADPVLDDSEAVLDDSEAVVVVVDAAPVLDLLLRVPPNAAFGLVLLSVFAAAL